MSAGKQVVVEIWSVVVMSVLRRRKRAVFWVAAMGTLGLMVGRRDCSHWGVGARVLARRLLWIWVATSPVAGGGGGMIFTSFSGVVWWEKGRKWEMEIC